MTAYASMDTIQLTALHAQFQHDYTTIKAKGLDLNMARGKPSAQQLALSLPLLDTVDSTSSLLAEDGTDTRNYGVLDGLPEAKRLMGELLDVPADNVIVCGNASLAIMYDTIDRAYTHGVLGSAPWCTLPKVRFLCPVPGYDRHFAVSEHFGFESVSIPMTATGPDMDLVEKLVATDPTVKGIWCVPTYANPTGVTYSDETVRRFAALTPAASDFRIFWDNAYVVHHLSDDPAQQQHAMEILSACAEAGHPDMVYEFASTSKVTFPGAGIACMAASKANVEDTVAQMAVHTIGYDKINQLRHVRFLRDKAGVAALMSKHAALLRPRFEAVQHALDAELAGTGIATWTTPRGGYFVSFDAMPGCAKAIVAKAAEAGVKLTGAGATYPHHDDPIDSNIRIAPSFPAVEDLEQALEVFVLCVKLVSIQKLLEQC
jgi:DNA-binding transcriptional MocR family regulator